jgi:hypothetical protein
MLESDLEAPLRGLREELNIQPPLVEGVMREVRKQHVMPRRPGTRRWLLSSSLGLAAAVAAACWFGFGLRATPAYGIEDVLTALLKVKSVHVKGKLFRARGDGKGVMEVPTEFFVERPCRSWGQGVGFSNDDPPRITYHAQDGKLSKYVDPAERTFIIHDDDPLLAELGVEGTLQNLLIDKLHEGGAEQFHKVGQEKINGRLTDRYERIQLGAETWRGSNKYDGDKYVVWLDPTTGLPVRTASYYFAGPRPDQLHLSVIEDIEANVAARPEMFEFDPPEGFRVIDARGQKQELLFGGSGGNGSERMGIGPASLNIDDRALLVCWAAYDIAQTPPLETELEGPAGRIIEPGKYTVISGPNPYHLVVLRADPGNDFHWRWSLLVPVDPDRRIGDDAPELRMNAKGGGSIGMGINGLRFPRQRLENIVVEIQRLTLPPGAPNAAVFTLAQIEELIDRVHRARAKDN